MALAPRYGNTYEIAKLFVERALARDDSLFTPGRAIWALGPLEELERCYVNNVDVSAGTFEEKLRKQLDGASDDAYQLMAEVMYVYFLPSRYNIKPETKRARLNELLSWSPRRTGIPRELDDALGDGVGSGGQGFHIYKWAILAQIIRYALAWKRSSQEVRDAALEDSWRFRELLESVPVRDGGFFAREALLHLVYPLIFERTFSHYDKSAITEAFAELGGDPADNVDLRLFRIRDRLTEWYGKDFDFYETLAVRVLWKPDEPWKVFVYWAERVRQEPDFDRRERDFKLQLAHDLARVAASYRSGQREWYDFSRLLQKTNLVDRHEVARFVAWAEQHLDELDGIVLDAWDGGGDNVARVRRFLDALPHDALPGTAARASLAAFIVAAVDPESSPPFNYSSMESAYKLTKLGEETPKGDAAGYYERAIRFDDELIRQAKPHGLELRDRLDAQAVIFGVTIDDIPAGWRPIEKRALEKFRATGPAPANDEVVDGTDEMPVGNATVSEPRATYSPDFEELAKRVYVSADELRNIVTLMERKKGQAIFYGPPGTGKTYIARELARVIAGSDERWKLVQFHPSYAYEDFIEGYRPTRKEGQQQFELRDGPFKRLAALAAADPEHKYVLVIDEINRGNVAKVLGELYFLLEYRDEPAELLYSQTAFRLPKNLWIIGTMNTADRSIALLDAALRRRFVFLPFFPDKPPIRGLLKEWLQANVNEMEWVAEIVDLANERLADRNGAIGHSFFMHADLDQRRLEQIWRHEVMPYLEDRFFDEPKRLDAFGLEALRKEVEAKRAAIQGMTEAAISATNVATLPPVPVESTDVRGGDGAA
jgi:5-methylcytosine-specific restriction protein B